MEASVEKVLEEAAQATQAVSQKKERKPKVAGEPRVKTVKEKLYVQWNEDGSPMLDAEGNRVKGPVKMAKPKSAKSSTPRAPAVPEHGVISGAPAGCREGSKRAERNKAFENASTVGDFYANGGLTKDLLRNIKSGAVVVTVGDTVFSV